MPHSMLKRYLEYASKVVAPKVTLDLFTNKSNNFWESFPTESARFYNLKKKGKTVAELERAIASTYPILHERVLPLLVNFIEYKKKNGTELEKTEYRDINLIDFVNRLLKKRPVTFYGTNDRYLLFNFKSGNGGFDEIGTHNEKYPIILRDYMSYDEMKIAALLNLSSESFFINNGSRDNKGRHGKEGTFNPYGVIMAQVGARMKKSDVMEWQDCVISNSQNQEQNGYGRDSNSLPMIWESLWDVRIPTWDEAIKDRTEKYIKLHVRSRSKERRPTNDAESNLFNVEVYKQRTQLSAEVLLSDARNRANIMGKKAYIHIVGLGLGVWKIAQFQEKMYIEAWGRAIKNIDTTSIAHIDFSWINVKDCHGVRDGEKFPNTNVTIHFSERNLHDHVPEGTFLICNFAWDGNSLPGNEYWTGKTSATGDGAAACSSCVAELQNHFVNDMVTAENLHISTKNGVFHIAEYAKHYIGDSLQELKLEKISSPLNPAEKMTNYISKDKSSSRKGSEKSDIFWDNDCNENKPIVDAQSSKGRSTSLSNHNDMDESKIIVDSKSGYDTAQSNGIKRERKLSNKGPDSKADDDHGSSKRNNPSTYDSISSSKNDNCIPGAASSQKKKTKKKSGKSKSPGKGKEQPEVEYGCLDFKSLK